TIFTYLVGRSLVSAITHTPASGPCGPATTPPMLWESILTLGDCASTGGQESNNAVPQRRVVAPIRCRVAMMGYLPEFVDVLKALNRPEILRWFAFLP